MDMNTVAAARLTKRESAVHIIVQMRISKQVVIIRSIITLYDTLPNIRHCHSIIRFTWPSERGPQSPSVLTRLCPLNLHVAHWLKDLAGDDDPVTQKQA